jgi:hypothetical protein
MQARSKFLSARALFVCALLSLVVSQFLISAFGQAIPQGLPVGGAPGVAPAGGLGGILGDGGILSVGRGPRAEPQSVAEALQQAKVNPENEPGDLKVDLQQLLQADLWLGEDDKPLWHAPKLAKQFAEEQNQAQMQKQSQQQNQTQTEEERRRVLIARLVRLIQKKQGEQEQDRKNVNHHHNNDDDQDDDQDDDGGRRRARREMARRSERKNKFHNNKKSNKKNNNNNDDDQDDDQDDGSN